MESRKVIIVGTGPTGYSAAIYNARAELKPLVLAGPEPGGQLTKTADVENYPGFEDGVTGPELMSKMMAQAERFGAEIKYETVSQIDFAERPFKVTTEQGEYFAESVVLAMGAKSRMLGVGEEKLLGKGVSVCAVCDAAFFKGKKTYVVGGGDAAIEDAWALTKYAESVTMIVRKSEFRASRVMQKRVTDNPDKIKVLWNTKVKSVEGEEKLEAMVVVTDGVPMRSDSSRSSESIEPAYAGRDDSVDLKSVSAESKRVELGGLFLAIGHLPATGFLKDSVVKLDDKGYIVTGLGLSSAGVEMAKTRINNEVVSFPTMTSVEGVFAAGDVVDFRYQQAVTAAGTGVMAALDAERWLESEDN